MSINNIQKLDKVGASLSLACAIHCMMMPILISLLPLIGLEFLLKSWFEKITMIAAVILSISSFCWGITKHRNFGPLILIFGGVLWYINGIGERHHWVFMSFCGICFLVASLMNKKLCNSCRKCNDISMILLTFIIF